MGHDVVAQIFIRAQTIQEAKIVKNEETTV